MRVILSLIVCVIASVAHAGTEGIYLVQIGGRDWQIDADTGQKIIDSIGIESAALVEKPEGVVIEVGDYNHEDLAYGALARIKRKGYISASIEYVTPEFSPSKYLVLESTPSVDDKTIVDRHLELLGEGSEQTETELWTVAENLIPESTGEQWPHEVAKAIPILVEIKMRFPRSTRRHEATALLGRYYTTTGWRTKNKALKLERYLTARQQFREVLNESTNAVEIEDAKMRLGHLNYGLRLLHPDREQRIAYLHESYQAFTDYLAKYPDGKQAERAQLEAIGLVFEMAKIGEISYEDALSESLKVEQNYPDANEYVASRSKLIKAEILGRMNRRDEAIRVCDEILSTYSDAVRTSLCTAHHYKADCLFALGKYEEAIRVYEEVLETYSEDDVMSKEMFNLGIMCNHFIGKCYLKLGQNEEAATHFQKVLDIDPTSIWAPITRQYLAELGQ